jgi:anti-sigma factor RsiW
MIAEDLEFSISQYADGTLSADERSAIDVILAVDPLARQALAEHRQIAALLAVPPAGIDWDRLADHLSSTVASDDAAAVVVGRIGPAGWGSPWRIGSIAAAAVVTLAVGLLAHHGRTSPAVVPVPPADEAVAVVTGPAVETGAGPAEAQVSIGPSPALVARGESWRYAEGVVSRPSSAVIAAAEPIPGRGSRVR